MNNKNDQAGQRKQSEPEEPVAGKGDNRRLGDQDGNRTAGNAKARGPNEPETAR